MKMNFTQSTLRDSSLLLVLTATNQDANIIQWAAESTEQIRSWLNKHGAILFRGFDISSIDKFEALASAATSDKWLQITEESSPRDPVKKNTFTSTRYQQDQAIFFHNENSYATVWPSNVLFYCDVPSTTGGETPLSDCRAIYKNIPSDIREKFEHKKLMYVRTFSNNMGIPWKKAFRVESKEELNEYCKKNAIEDISWKKDGTPVLKYVRNTSLIHPITGDPVWFNHGTFFNVHSLEQTIKYFFLNNLGQEALPFNTYYGDGSEIEEDVIHTLRDLYEKHSTSYTWEKGDVVLIDNMLTAHGRKPFEGERNILVAMTDPMERNDISFV